MLMPDMLLLLLTMESSGGFRCAAYPLLALLKQAFNDSGMQRHSKTIQGGSGAGFASANTGSLDRPHIPPCPLH